MAFREVVLSIEGLREKDKYLHDLLRRATMIIGCSGFAGKEISKRFDKLWPVMNQPGKPTRREEAYAFLKKLKEIDQKNADIKKVKEIING